MPLPAPSRFRRTPLPEAFDQTWRVLAWWSGLIASPFAGFWVAGRVDERGLAIGGAVALVPLCGLAALAWRRHRAWRALPQVVRDEYRSGRLVMPQTHAGAEAPPATWSGREDDATLLLDKAGVTISAAALLSAGGLRRALATSWLTRHAGQLHVPWTDIREWEVHDDSDAPDFYRLALADGGQVRIRRLQRNAAVEATLLQAVLDIGQRPVRLFTDVG